MSYPADLIGTVYVRIYNEVLTFCIGRKRTIHIGSFFFVIGSVLQTAAHNIGTLYAGRFVGGLGIGQMSAVVPLYISETAETDIRGRLISIYQVSLCITKKNHITSNTLNSL